MREVIATFGRRESQLDAAWETEFASSLRNSHGREQLIDLFGRFREGESSFDFLMRRVLMKAMCRAVGHGMQVGPGVVLKHPETMEFGDSVFIGAQAMIQGRYDGDCRIGNHVWIGPQAYFDARSLSIEDYVGWGPGAKVLGSAHTGEPLDVPVITTNLMIKPVHIGFGADIGMNASVLPGVTVGPHAIVGAGAVAAHDVPAYAVVAGVPARTLRFRNREAADRESGAAFQEVPAGPPPE